MWFFDFLSNNSNITIHDLEDVNLWRPKNPNIEINPNKPSDKIPQAFEYYGNWYYNFPWAIAETKYLNKRMPTKNEWKQIIKSDDFKFKLPILGSGRPYGRDYHKEIDHVLLDQVEIDWKGGRYWKGGYYWSSSKEIWCNWAFYLAFFDSWTGGISSYWCACIMPVRCFKN